MDYPWTKNINFVVPKSEMQTQTKFLSSANEYWSTLPQLICCVEEEFALVDEGWMNGWMIEFPQFLSRRYEWMSYAPRSYSEAN